MPGVFLDQDLDLLDAHMRVNYSGTLNLVHAVAPLMREAGGGRIGLISSGAAFFGIYGYSGYAPSKFAVRALGEVLRVELAEWNISVTVCYPPDTETPMLETENLTKPDVTRIVGEGGGLWQAADVARLLLRGMERGRFAVTPGWQMGVLNWLGPVIAPVMRWHQVRIARKRAK